MKLSFFNAESKRKTRPDDIGGRVPHMSFINTPDGREISADEDTALTFSAYFACVKIIAESIACLPWNVMEQDGESSHKATDHPVSRLLRRKPNPEMEPFTFKFVVFADAICHGAHYSEIEYNRRGEPIALWPLDPRKTEERRDDNGRLYYRYRQPGGDYKDLQPRSIFRVLGMSFDGVTPVSILTYAKKSIEMGLHAERFGSALFRDAGIPSGVIINKGSGKISAEGIKNLLSTWNRRNKRRRKTEYLDGDMEYHRISISPEDAQFLLTRKFQLLEMCRWFRMPPHKLAELEQSHHSNIESQNIEFVTDTLMPWIVRAEGAANFRLVDDDVHYTKFNVNALLRGDTKSREEFYKTMLDRGVYSINDVLRKEDENPIGGVGDTRLVQRNMIPLEDYADGSYKENLNSMQRVSQISATRMAKKQHKAVSRMAAKGSPDSDFLSFFQSHRLHILEEVTSIYAAFGVDATGREGAVDKFLSDSDITGGETVEQIAARLMNEVYCHE